MESGYVSRSSSVYPAPAATPVSDKDAPVSSPSAASPSSLYIPPATASMPAPAPVAPTGYDDGNSLHDSSFSQ